MLRYLFDPKANDNDTPYKEQALSVALRFADALKGKRYSEIWHELVVDETKEVYAALSLLRHREDIAGSFQMPATAVTQEFLSYALANDIEGVRTGLWDGLRQQSKKAGWFRRDDSRAQVAFLNTAALVALPSGQLPLIIPLLRVAANGYKVDLDTFVLASYTLKVQDFVLAAEQATDAGDFQGAIQLLEDAARFRRSHELLRQHAWQLLFTSQRRSELQEDARLLPRVEALLVENKELASLNIAAALRHDEDETMDFKREMPPTGKDKRWDLPRDLAAFSTSGGGRMYFGITDKPRQVIGIEEAKTEAGRDAIRGRVDAAGRDSVSPAIAVRVVFMPYSAPGGHVMVPVVVIPSGTEPVYYVDHKPCLRRGQSTGSARSHEVAELHRQHLIGRGWRPPAASAVAAEQQSQV